jgi:hypothetical protein
MKTTPGPDCTVCTHKKRRAIEEQLAAGVPIRGISQQVGTGGPSHDAIQRHKQNCMREAVLAAREADAIAIVEEGRTIVERCREVNREAWALLTEAKSEQDRKVYASLLGQALKSLELEAKLLGELGPTNATQTNVQINMGREAEKLPPWLASSVPDHDQAAVGTVWVAAGKPDSVDEMLAEWDELGAVTRRYAGVRR